MKLNKLLSLLLFLIVFQINASDVNVYVDSARNAYERGEYAKAVTLYEAILDLNYESAELYYNLGNAYFKDNEIGLAILNYEKSKKLNPQNEDLLANLKMANHRVEDKIDEAPELFLNRWKKSIFNMFNEQQWSFLVIATFILSLLLIVFYIVSSNKLIKQTGFFGGAFLLILTIAGLVIASNKYSDTVNSSEAVVISPSSNVNGAPNEKSTKLFILHEGTKVKITQETENWTEIKIANNNVGWIKSTSLKKI